MPPLFALFIVIVFATGGGARSDIASLAFLRPLAVVFAGMMLATGATSDFRAIRGPLIWLATLMSWILLQLIPLPAGWWAGLPGHASLAKLPALAGVAAVARPINLWPDGGWNAFFACFVPLAALLAAARLHSAGRMAIVSLLALIGFVSGVLGLLQLLGPSGGPLYLYEITNAGQAVGLFANRNHQAVLLAITLPTLAVTHRIARPMSLSLPAWTALFAALAAFLLPLIVITGSRAGLLLLIPAIASVPFIVGWRHFRDGVAVQRGVSRRRLVVFAIVVVIVVLVVAAYATRLTSIQRLFATDLSDESRVSTLPIILHMIMTYFPFGAGFGSFAEVFRIFEPDALAYGGYLNQAHNDVMQFVLEGGLPAALLMFAGIVAVARRLLPTIRTRADMTARAILARWGLVVIGLLSLASIADYPLRTPSMAALFAVAICWLWTSRVSS